MFENSILVQSIIGALRRVLLLMTRQIIQHSTQSVRDKSQEMLFLLFGFIICTNASIFGRQGLHENFDYDFYPNKIEKKSIRGKFLHEKQENRDEENQIKILEQLTENNTLDKIYFEEIPHFKIQKNMSNYEKVTNMENEFETMLSMKGLKYDFQRDFHWRTWRTVNYSNGTSKLIFYKCLSEGNESCSGIWAIEDPPCPYEITSMKSKGVFCVVHLSTLSKRNGSCPTTLEVNDLTGKCRNPIVTRWRFERTYSNDSERVLPLFSRRRERFELLTLYRINDEEIIFQIVNSSNHVVYSKIMRSGGSNYACVDSCGIINPRNWKIIAAENPLSFNLLPENYKKKREDTEAPRKHKKIPKNRKPHNNTLLDDTDYVELVINNDILDNNIKETTTETVEIQNVYTPNLFDAQGIVLDNEILDNPNNDSHKRDRTPLSKCDKLYQEMNNLNYFDDS